MARRLGALLASLAYSVAVCCALSLNDFTDSERGQTASPVFVNSWAVKIIGGKAEADAVARRNGYQNLGQVPGLAGIYHFRLGGGGGGGGQGLVRSDVPYSSNLAGDRSVVFAEQQSLEKHVTKWYTVPQDPLFSEQWNLLNDGQYGVEYAGNDLRVEQAWLQGYTGCNVTVSVVDDGMDFRHPDLWDNFAPSASYDFVGFDNDPSNYKVRHGTRCAGVIASEKGNTYCGVGIAHRSNLGALELINDVGTMDMQDAMALSYALDIIDVYSNSWGPIDNGFTVGFLRNMTQMALEKGVTEGRNGKGSIYVWANGNGGEVDDDCAADGYASSIYTISVGGIGVNGSSSYFDERCSAKMVVAYVTNDRGITAVRTTDTGGGCWSHFGGTSSATPMVSGAVALALEAKPDLTWRDVQYLIAYTANPDLTAGPVTRNGAGLAVSRQFGFGVMDAEAMVTRARNWINVPEQIKDRVTNISRKFLPAITYSAYANYNGQIAYLEHVVVQMTVVIPNNTFHLGRGDVEIALISPSGTVSVLLQPRPLDYIPDGYYNWPFMSVMFWGEDPTGEWNIHVRTRSHTGVALVGGIEFIFYGVSTTPQAVANIPAECHSDCRRGCAGEGSDLCDSCVKLRNAHTLKCINECPLGFTERNGYCYNQTVPLKECDSPLKSKEGTGHFPSYEQVTCADSGFDKCCTNGSCFSAHNPFHPEYCFCDSLCFDFEDCCDDAALIGCLDENVTHTFPYVDLGVTPDVITYTLQTQFAFVPSTVPFPFGTTIQSDILVSTDGYVRLFQNESDESLRIITPFFSNPAELSGKTSFEIHEGSNSQEVLSYVNAIINEHENASFNGVWLIVVHWENLTSEYSDLNNTFQGILVTDLVTSYAVFTYKCGDLSYSQPGEIFVIDRLEYLEIYHAATYRNKPHDIACLNLPSPWVNVVYKVTTAENECESDNGGCEQICIDTFLSNNCSCSTGYALNDDGQTCSDIDECLDSDHGCTGNCVNTDGSYMCTCDEGYELNENGHDCDDTDECLLSEDSCEQECVNTIGSYFCTCINGFVLAEDGHSCSDVDECLGSDLNDCEQSCTNTIGSYSCSCSGGYELDDDGKTCTDVDECTEQLDNCEMICVNSIGSYTCICGEGYILNDDGLTCEDVDECLGDHDCEHSCTNTIGSYICNCTEGYELNADGRTCSDVDECEEGIDSCEQNCLNNEGSYSCSCRESYDLEDDGKMCTVSCGGTLTGLFGSFKTPDWPDSYPAESFTCRWVIQIQNPDAKIQIDFDEPYGIFESSPCTTDYVELFEGVESSDTSMFGKLCGNEKPDETLIDSNTATVVFKGSDSSQMDKSGVSIRYKTVLEELQFIELDESNGVAVHPLPDDDDGLSESILVPSTGFPLGCMTNSRIYVGTNGYFTFKPFTGFTPFTFEEGNRLSLVAPFFADIDISTDGIGDISYSIHDDLTNTFSNYTAETIDATISTALLTTFKTKWFVVAYWKETTAYGRYNTHATFQGVLATDFTRSFAIFIYRCNGGEAPRFTNYATIGYVTRDGFHKNHPPPDPNNPYSVSCTNAPKDWTNVIYKISAGEDECPRSKK